MIKNLSVLSEMVDVAAGEIDRFHYDRAHVILAQAQALAMIEIAASLARLAEAVSDRDDLHPYLYVRQEG